MTRRDFAAGLAILLTVSCGTAIGPEPEPTVDVAATVEAAISAAVEAISVAPAPESTVNVEATVEAAVAATVEAIAAVDSPEWSELEIAGRVRNFLLESRDEASTKAYDFSENMGLAQYPESSNYDPSVEAAVNEVFAELAVSESMVSSLKSYVYHGKGVWVVTLEQVLAHEIFQEIDTSKTRSVTFCISESSGDPFACDPE